MKSLFEPLLDNLLQVAASPVQLLDQSGQILYKQVPRGCNDLALSDPVRFESEQKRMQQVSCPVCLSSAGMEQEVAGWYFPDGSTLLIGPVERRSGEALDTFVLRKNAINAQLKSLAWTVRRLVPQTPPQAHQFEGDPIAALKECPEIRPFLPQWSEVLMEENSHSSYLFELRILDAISQGNPEQVEASQGLQRNGQDGILGYTKLRSNQNLAICGVVLNSRAAIAGGLSVEQAYTMADYFILAIERCQNADTAYKLGLKSAVIFAQLVQKLKSSVEQKQPPRYLSQQALEVIRRYLFIKVDRAQIAAELKVNEDYLDRVLKEDLNVTVTECLRNERLEEAKRLLVQSETPVYEIASLLLFSHSSHFIRVFKEYVGMTPEAYRRHKASYNTTAEL